MFSKFISNCRSRNWFYFWVEAIDCWKSKKQNIGIYKYMKGGLGLLVAMNKPSETNKQNEIYDIRKWV